MEKEIKINCPEGYEIDKENSTFECIKFKPVKPKLLPKTWEEFCKTHSGKPSIELAEAMLALCKLIQLRDCYNEGWLPKESYTADKYSIDYDTWSKGIVKSIYTSLSPVLSFKTEELRDKFFENFKDLIEIAKPLL